MINDQKAIADLGGGGGVKATALQTLEVACLGPSPKRKENMMSGVDMSVDPKTEFWDPIPGTWIRGHMRSYIRVCHFDERSSGIQDPLVPLPGDLLGS